MRSPASPLVLPLRHCKRLKRIISCFVVYFIVSVFSAHTSLQHQPTCAEGLSLCIVFIANFALRNFVEDDEPADVSVSLLTPQLRCTFVYLRTFFDTEEVLLSARLCFEIATRKSNNS